MERPGSGMSDPHASAAIADWAPDMAHVPRLDEARLVGDTRQMI
ncbi:hypothetical protein [Mycobacterium sp. 1164966.3]